MVAWQRSLRFLLMACILGVGAAVLFGIRDRTEPASALVVERTDPEAVIETRGSRIVQADALGENLRVVADRQDTYRDGALRLVDNVQVTVADREDRPGFVLTGNEARVDAGKTEVLLSGGVRLESSDGLSATTEEAAYLETDGVIRMPGATAFAQEGMEATAATAEYDRTADVLRLLAAAKVDLVSDQNRTHILSQRATLAQAHGYMHFEDDVTIDTGSRRMSASRARAALLDDSTTLQALELEGQARITGGADDTQDTLRAMSADDITLAYSEDGLAIESAILSGRARLDTAGTGGAAGSAIASDSMELMFDPDDTTTLRQVSARTRVRWELPERAGAPGQTITADALTVTGEGATELDEARFEGHVEFQERIRGDDGRPTVRITRSDRLDARLSDGLSELSNARFLGNVTFEDPDVMGVADEALYEPGESRVQLLTVGPEGRTPRFEDRRGSVQARAINLGLDDSHVAAEGEVESVLITEPGGDPETPGTRRPGLLEPDEPAFVTAGRLEYDGEAETAVYIGEARLWQGDTEFHGDRIVLDEANGNITAEGDVRTRSLIRQTNDETGLQEESVTTGRGRHFVFDDTAHRATYTTDAQVTGPRGDLAADLIHLFLLPDSRTLDRIEATGAVTLTMSGRWISGTSLVYHDAEGRYEMEGEPVQIVEEIEDACRETTGRTLTFYLTDDAVSVDGESEVRTETLRGDCPELTP